jgi:hypothetical protein
VDRGGWAVIADDAVAPAVATAPEVPLALVPVPALPTALALVPPPVLALVAVAGVRLERSPPVPRLASACLITAATPTVPASNAVAMATKITPRLAFTGNAAAVSPPPDVTLAGGCGVAEYAGTDAFADRAPPPEMEAGPRRTLNPAASARESPSSDALAKRSPGSRESARRNHTSNEGGSSALARDGRGGSDVQIFTSRSPTLSPSNGSRPVTHRKAITPRDHWSDR